MSQLAVKQKRYVSYLHELTYQIIQERKMNLYVNVEDAIRKLNNNEVNSMNNCLTFLELLIQKGKEGKVDLDGIREEIDKFIFAGTTYCLKGHDSIATALCFFVVRIANEPEVLVDTKFQQVRNAIFTYFISIIDKIISPNRHLYSFIPFGAGPRNCIG